MFLKDFTCMRNVIGRVVVVLKLLYWGKSILSWFMRDPDLRMEIKRQRSIRIETEKRRNITMATAIAYGRKNWWPNHRCRRRWRRGAAATFDDGCRDNLRSNQWLWMVSMG
ncbi:hypothetical protein L2E82_18089 [Cichorium intybus]|uniref:Uncharacterized protein n=1 Tax=Cichorium intybus TaxID=13427 RepID=A0ACB9FAM2_CICIN|nr:hypothetical protein L2E82_18089 [Cichorium intybus]